VAELRGNVVWAGSGTCGVDGSALARHGAAYSSPGTVVLVHPALPNLLLSSVESPPGSLAAVCPKQWRSAPRLVVRASVVCGSKRPARQFWWRMFPRWVEARRLCWLVCSWPCASS